MERNRLEAFSDGVIAIIITIMVLELKPPHTTDFHALIALLPVFLSYLLSFIYVAIYWNNHHHLLHTVKQVDGLILWANIHLLFWLSLVPFTTAWIGENQMASLPTAIYAFVLLMCAVAYYLLQLSIIRLHGHESVLARAIGNDFKGKGSLLLYSSAIGLSFINPYISHGVFIAVALMWLVPDRRIEKKLEDK